MERVSPLPGQVMLAIGEDEMGDYDADRSAMETQDVDKATLLTSMVAGSWDYLDQHKIVLDIDLPAQLIPSSTSGHFHLIIDHQISWDRYSVLLDALAEAGVIELGYAQVSKNRGYTAVRMPWIRKPGAMPA